MTVSQCVSLRGGVRIPTGRIGIKYFIAVNIPTVITAYRINQPNASVEQSPWETSSLSDDH